jgi:hypothetical protein
MTTKMLGWNIPAVHRSMDWAVRVLGPRHQLVMHGASAVRAMELLFGKRGRIIACIHILQDLGVEYKKKRGRGRLI